MGYGFMNINMEIANDKSLHTSPYLQQQASNMALEIMNVMIHSSF